MEYLTFSPGELNAKDMHQFILGAINPRPIAFVSTKNAQGQSNLAPYSFFNAISSNPPVVLFSANTRPGPSPHKDTLINIRATGNCVINIVNHTIWHQAAIASVEFDYGISEFEKSGLTPLASEEVASDRVAESPVQMECTLRDIIVMGNDPGASNLIICNVERMHVNKNIMDGEMRRIDPQKADIMGRLGRSNYVRVKGDNILSLYQPVRPACIGYDSLPSGLRKSRFFTGNDLGKFAALNTLPDFTEVENFMRKEGLQPDEDREFYHRRAKRLLDENRIDLALKMALIPEIG